MKLLTYGGIDKKSILSTLLSLDCYLPKRIVLYNSDVELYSYADFLKDVPSDMKYDPLNPIERTYKYLCSATQVLKGFIYDSKYIFIRENINLISVLLHELGHLNNDYEDYEDDEIKYETAAHEWAFDKIFSMNRNDWFISYMAVLEILKSHSGPTVYRKVANTTLRYFSDFDYDSIRSRYLSTSKFKFKSLYPNSSG